MPASTERTRPTTEGTRHDRDLVSNESRAVRGAPSSSGESRAATTTVTRPRAASRRCSPRTGQARWWWYRLSGSRDGTTTEGRFSMVPGASPSHPLLDPFFGPDAAFDAGSRPRQATRTALSARFRRKSEAVLATAGSRPLDRFAADGTPRKPSLSSLSASRRVSHSHPSPRLFEARG